MKFFARALDLRNDPALIDEYLREHRAVWPEVVAGLRAIGIRRMRIFRVGTRLFMYCEVDDAFDPERDFARYASDPRCVRWEEWMKTFQTPIPGSPPGDWWTPMEPVFDLESA
jgi:L-rhamnose mutarotase